MKRVNLSRPTSAGYAPSMGKRGEREVVRLDRLRHDDLIALVPREDIERIVATPVSWRVIQSQRELIERELVMYNACVSTHVQRRWMLNRDRPNPLEKKAHLSVNADYWRIFDYVHNQCVIEAKAGNVTCALVYLSVAANRFLHLNDIELANPNTPETRPLESAQKYAGLGQGVFAEIIRRLRVFAGQHGLQEVIGYTADAERLEIFKRRGFELDTSDPLHVAAFMNGRQFPIRIAPLP